MLVDQKMSCGDSKELSGMGIPCRAFMLVHKRNDMPGKSTEKLEEKNTDVPQMLSLCPCHFQCWHAHLIVGTLGLSQEHTKVRQVTLDETMFRQVALRLVNLPHQELPSSIHRDPFLQLFKPVEDDVAFW